MSHHHRPVRMRGLAIAGLALACGCATRAPVRPGQLAQVGPSSRAEAPSAEEVTITAASGDFEQRAALATQLLQERAYVGADEQLQKLTASAEFETVGPGRQYAILKAESWTAAQRHDLPRAEALLQRVTALPTALPEDWRALSLLAAANQDWTAAAQSLATLAQHSAPIVSTIESRRLKEIVQRAPVAGDLRYHLLTALFGAQPHLAGTDLSNWWRDLALLHLAHHELAAALAAVRAITDPYGVVVVFADNRFAPVRHALKGELDVAAAAQRKIESSRLEAEADPARLQLRSQLSDALMDSLRYNEALEVIDAALAKADAPNGRSGFADYTTAYVW
ncbi:MAG: hypothetical protein JOZ03_10495, partial [Gammaproteobacteria bacterium]|nr:hypothetical protein [Gammaproteobacteria bacterium]